MTDKNRGLTLALEAEHEAEVVADTYEGLAQVLDIEGSLSDAHQASDVALGLESLSIVLENLKELDGTDLAMIQVIGDIAGASSGMNGAYFTPAMEDMEDDGVSPEDKSASIMEKIAEIIKYVIEKINKFIAWAMEKFRVGFKNMKEAGANLKGLVGRQMEVRKINKVRERLGGMIEMAKGIEAFIPVVADLAAVRLESSAVDAGHIEEPMPVSIVNKMESLYRQLEAFEKKFGEKTWSGGVEIKAVTERISHNNVLSTEASFSKNYFAVSQSVLGTGADDASDETMGKIGHDLISEIEDVIDLFSRFMGESGTLSLTTLSKSIKVHLEGIRKVISTDEARSLFNRHGQRLGKTKVAVLREVVNGVNKDVSAVVKLSGALDSQCNALSKMLNGLKQVDMEPAAA